MHPSCPRIAYELGGVCAGGLVPSLVVGNQNRLRAIAGAHGSEPFGTGSEPRACASLVNTQKPQQHRCWNHNPPTDSDSG